MKILIFLAFSELNFLFFFVFESFFSVKQFSAYTTSACHPLTVMQRIINVVELTEI